MTVYSFYIFDRHTECIYHRSWVSFNRLPVSNSSSAPSSRPVSTSVPPLAGATTTTTSSSSLHQQHQTQAQIGKQPPQLPFGQQHGGVGGDKDNAKLVFGTVFSLRNMVRKLGGNDDAFISYRTADYKLHFYETPSNLRLVMITDTATMSMRNVLHQIYVNLWVEYVVKNPLSPVEHKGGDGVKNELFELGLDQFVKSLS